MSDATNLSPNPEITEPPETQLPKIYDFEWRSAVQDVLIEHGPDYVYQSPRDSGECVYFDHDGCASCLFGRVLAKFGLTIDRIGLHEGADVGQVMYALKIHEEALVYACNSAQNDQDSGTRYGDVLLAFNARYAAFNAGRDSV